MLSEAGCSLRATGESDRTLGECLYPSVFKIFYSGPEVISTILYLKSYYFVYLIIYINLLKTWIHIFFSVNEMGLLSYSRLNFVPFHKLVFSTLFRKERDGIGPAVTEPFLIAASLTWSGCLPGG